jgi:hypothetical protein
MESSSESASDLLTNKEKLKEKLKSKKKQRSLSARKDLSTALKTSNEPDILSMMEQVNSLLRTNPELVKQVSKCVSNVMNDKTLMESLSGKIKDQTLDTNVEDEEPDASS